MILGSNCLRRVFDDGNAALPSRFSQGFRRTAAPRQLDQWIHLRALAVEMHRNDRLGAFGDRVGYQRGTDVVGLLVNVHEYRPRAEPRDRACGRKETKRRGNDFITVADAAGHQGQQQRVRSRSAADGKFGLRVACDLFFQRLHFRAEHELL